MIQINENISYLPKQTEPLSAEVFFIKKMEKYTSMMSEMEKLI